MSLVAAARKLYAWLEPHAVLIGGICGAMHGVERFTRDVDIATDLTAEGAVAALTQHGISSTLRRGAPGEPLSWVVSGTIDGVDFQVLPATDVGVQPKNAELRAELKIASVLDFIESKCRAAGQQDLHDVAALTLIDPTLLPAAREKALAHQCADKLDLWLDDRRLLARYRR